MWERVRAWWARTRDQASAKGEVTDADHSREFRQNLTMDAKQREELQAMMDRLHDAHTQHRRNRS